MHSNRAVGLLRELIPAAGVRLRLAKETRRALLLLLFAGLCGISAGWGQTADLTQWTSGYSRIDQAWRFHTGDDPQWAQPDFDDTHWSLLQLDKSWAKQGYKDYSGFAWYRIQLRLPESGAPLALLLYPPANSVEVYLDGRPAATIGQMRPTPQWRMRSAVPVVVLLARRNGGRTTELALRVWESKLAASSTGAGSAALPLLGSARAIEELHALAFNRFAILQLPAVLPFVVSTVIAVFSFALFLIRLRAREYLWGALWLLSGPAYFALDMLRQAQQWPMPVSVLTLQTIQALGLVFWLLFIWRFVESGDDWKLKIGVAAIALLPIGVLLVMMGAIPIAGDYLLSLAITLALGILLLIHLLRLALGGNRDAQIFLAPFLLYFAMGAVDDLRGALFFLGVIAPYNANSESFALYHSAAFTVTGQQFFSLLSYLTLAVVLILRFARSAREEQRLNSELQSARQVQSHLVPAAPAPTAHFRFDAAYFAASEVGGDFYQVIPAADGSALVALGDVSGKGLNAAMFATLVVGAAVKGQILGNQIMFNGNVISTTDGSDPPVQNVVVGQQIVLTTTPTTTAYEGNPVSQQWTVGPTNIGGYPASTAGASVTPTTLSQPTLTTYWVYPGTAIPVTYKYCVKILFTQGADPVKQCSLPANASFTVTGGGTISNIPFGALTYEQLIPCLGNVRPPLGSPTAPFVVYGNTTGWNCAALYPGSTYGISFQPSGAPSGGTYSYVQLINKDNPTSSDATSSSGCAYSQGVDKTYPYQAIIPFTDPPQAEDAPADDLIPGYVETRTFNATMFLLWTPPGSGSIPVPLGYQSWGFSGGASQDITGAWSATTNGKPGPVGGFVPSDGSQTTDGYTTLQYGYPIWSGLALCN